MHRLKIFRFSHVINSLHAFADLFGAGVVVSHWRHWLLVALLAGSAETTHAQLANGDFDATPLSPAQYLYYATQSQPVDSWTYAGNAGIATDSSNKVNFATGYPGVYAETNYAFLQARSGTPGSIEQSVMLPTTGQWLMSFSFAGRLAGAGYGGNASFRASVMDSNGVELVSRQLLTSSGQLFTNQAIAFSAQTNGPFRLRFNNVQNTSGTDNTVFIDNVRLISLPAPPTATTLAASDIIATNGTLNATVNPNGLPTSAWFQYGPTTNYGLFSATNSLAAGVTALSVSDVISSLSPLTLYHFQIMASNSAGGATGADQTFTTPRLPVTVSITNNGDSGPGTLRQSILNSAPGDRILFDASLSGSSILLTSGQLLVTNNLTIDVSALLGGLTVTGNGNTRLFNVTSSATVVLTGLTMINGVAVNSGGGIFNAGTLTLNRCTLAGNSAIGATGSTGASAGLYSCGSGSPGGTGAMGAGGAIYNQGTLTVNECTLAGNLAQGGTGGNGGNGGSCISVGAPGGNGGNGGDGGPGAGGAIYNTGVLAVNQCTLATNTASGGSGGSRGFPGYGSGGFGSFGNPGSDGSGTGGGIYESSALTLFNSIVAGNSPDNIVGTMVATGNNLTNGNPLLSALGNNGGLTPTMLLLPGSPAFDNGAPTSFTSDQRGFPRISGAAPDIGAVEMTVADVATLPATDVTGTAATLNGTVNPNGTATSVFFQYGTNTNYGSFTGTNALANNDTALLVQGRITNLQLSNTYHFRIVAMSAFGPIMGSDQTFTTGVVAAAPSVSSLVATVIATNGTSGVRSVQLSAFVNPNGGTTAAYFEYGLTTAYPGTNNFVIVSATNLAVTLAFSAGSSYHWRVVASNAAGAVTSPDQTFWLGSGALAGDLNGDGVVRQDELDAVYDNYVINSPWLYMTNVTGLGGTNVTFALSNSLLGAYTVQSSTNLVDWSDLGPAAPRYLFTDTNAPALPQRYYRLRYP